MLGTSEVFAPGGVLEARLKGYEVRDGQRQMAEAVASAIARRSILLAEAGTGTGKTFAYCVPAILSGKRVIISTATKNLQDQIAQRDLPRLCEALGVNARISVLKGRQNYLCLHRLDRVARQPSLRFRGKNETLDEIAEWSATTTTGDRAELRTLPDDYMPWRELDARSDICLGPRCPRYDACFVTRARQAASAAEIVVVNHYLFFADLALRQQPNVETTVLPAYDVVIFDEAHALEEAVTDHFGVSFSETRAGELTKDVLQALDDELVPGEPLIRAALAETPMALGRLFHEIGDAPGSSRALPKAREPMKEAANDVAQAFSGLAKAIEDGARGPAWDALAMRAEKLAREVAFVFAPDADDAMPFARMIEQRSRSRQIRALPLDVGGVLRNTIFDDGSTIVLTSATLSVGGDFSVLRDRLGIETAEELVVESPFDYRTQALVYVPSTFPEPSAPAYAEALSERLLALNDAAKGGAFFLFTSHAQLDRQAQALTPLLRQRGHLVFKQGDAPKHVLIEDFARDGSAVLFASASFWEGVDVPGDALRLVCIDKLPFASPTDPLLAARIAEVERQGESAFASHQLAPAVIALRQGFGRLIRTAGDRGVVAVLDVRLRTKSYGRKFLGALPPAPKTASLDDVRAFFSADSFAASASPRG
ncbi:MAG: ATP-dependent DNA helicase [Deltaproteobacteria bacterium]|nr:ATP-dependent DNA helicase [Deltaproteobacteria bacterium]